MKRALQKHRARIYPWVVLIGLGWLSTTSCEGDGAGLTASGDLPGDQPGTGLSRMQPLFDTNCTRCHAPGGIGYQLTGGDTQNGLDLRAGQAFGALVDRPTFEDPGTSPRWRVLPGEPDSSYLIQKISSDRPKDGDRMPLDGPPFLSSGDIERIRSWIEDGAVEN